MHAILALAPVFSKLYSVIFVESLKSKTSEHNIRDSVFTSGSSNNYIYSIYMMYMYLKYCSLYRQAWYTQWLKLTTSCISRGVCKSIQNIWQLFGCIWLVGHVANLVWSRYNSPEIVSWSPQGFDVHFCCVVVLSLPNCCGWDRGGCHASSNSRHLEEDVVNSLCNLQVRTIMSFEKSSIHHKTAYFSSMRRPMVDHWVANGCPMVVNIVVQFMSKRSNMHVSIYVQAKLHLNF